MYIYIHIYIYIDIYIYTYIDIYTRDYMNITGILCLGVGLFLSLGLPNCHAVEPERF